MKTKTTTAPDPRPRRGRLTALVAMALAAALVAPASALAVPALGLSTSHQPPISPVPVGTWAEYTLDVTNTGTSATTEPVTVDFSVPAGFEITRANDEVAKEFPGFNAWACTIAPDSRSASCIGPEFFFEPVAIAPGQGCEVFGFSCNILVSVKADSNAPLGPMVPTVTACGGGGATACPGVGATAPDDPVEIVPKEFHVTKFDGAVLEQNGDPATQAGSHPYTAGTEFAYSTVLDSEGLQWPMQDLQDAIAKLPPGLVADVQGMPQCAEAHLREASYGNCPPETQVGMVMLAYDGYICPIVIPRCTPDHPSEGKLPLYNMEPPPGTPAVFGFNVSSAIVHVFARVRTGEDYGVTLASLNAPESVPFAGVKFRVWGVPADPSHDSERWCAGASQPGCSSPDSANPTAFVSLPTSCVGPVETFLHLTTWAGGEGDASFLSHAPGEPSNTIGNDGCNAVDFSPTLEARPTTNVADSPSGLDVALHVPQGDECIAGPPVSCETAEAHLRDTVVTLPEGLVVNPSGANGLDGCSLSEFGFTSKEGDVIHTTPDPATCPDASKLGTVQVDSPLLDHPVKGSVHIADPYANPFDSLLAIYITLDDPQTGIVVKLAGQVHADPGTGRLTTTVLHNPELPFEDFMLHFFGGAGGSLRTPITCGQYTTSSSLTPWSAPESGPPDEPSDFWAITQAPGGGTCPTSQGARPNSPDLDAGAISPIAASYTPSVVNLRRNDGSQEFSSVNLTLPPGLTGKLAGVGQCSDAALATAASKTGNQEKQGPSCPASSRIGTVDVAAGAGPAPYNAQGTAYLAGPYKGAPLSMAIITPATAGPFDLGTVVVRVALHLNSNTGRITAISDPIPSILQGIPLDVRSAQVKLDRPEFTRTGTSCDPLSFSGSLTSTLGQVAPLAERFQLGECGRLSFKPKLGIRLIGGTKRGAHPALKATLTMPEGANIAKASVALPKSEFLDQAHIGTVCTRVQFAADACPAASVYGRATATSPLVDYPLSGPAYLRSSSNKLPDLVIALKGPPSQPIEVDAVARIDSVKGRIRSTFEGVPDLPVSSFVLEMEGGRKGLLQNSTNICRGTHKATAEFDAQNGKVADLAPVLKNSKCGKAKRKAAQRKRRAEQRLAAR